MYFYCLYSACTICRSASGSEFPFWLRRCGSKHKFYTWGKMRIFLLLISHYFAIFYLSHQGQRCHVFQYFRQHIDIFWNTGNNFLSSLLPLGINTDPEPPDPDQHALDADPSQDPNPTKWCGSDPIRIHDTDVCYIFHKYSWSGSETLIYSARTVVLERSTSKFYIYSLGICKVFFFNYSWPMFYRCETWTESRHLHSQPERRTESQGRGQLCVPEVPGPGGRVRGLVHLCAKGRAQVSGTGPSGSGQDAHCQGQGCVDPDPH